MNDKTTKYMLAAISLIIPLIFASMTALIVYEAIPAFTQIGAGLFDKSGSWRPLSNEPSFSILPMIFGTLYVSFLAVSLTMPIGCGCAVFLNYFIDNRLKNIILSFIELLAGIPSVIFGFLGLLIVVKNFEALFNMSTGECVLAAAIVLSIMLLPFVICTYSETVERAKSKYNNASVALGIPAEYSLLRIIMPITRKGAAAAAAAAFGRALGETMAVMMVIGNSPIFPTLFGRGRTIPSLTALEIGSAEYGSLHLSAIYSANLIVIVLLGIVLTVSSLLQNSILSGDEKGLKISLGFINPTVLKWWAYVSGSFVIAVAVFLFGYIFYKGAPVITWDFIFDSPKGVPIGTDGGIFPAITGAIYFGGLSGLIGGAIGVAASIYIVFYCGDNIINKIIGTCVYFLSGFPSILFGLVGYTVLIQMLGLARSLLTASLTVSVMITPFVIIRLVKVFKYSEDSAKMLNTSLCLGVSKTYALRALILPNYIIEILTTITLSMAYGIGATAPVMYTGAVIYAETPKSVTQPFMTLSYHLYILANDGISMKHAYGTAAVLMFLLLAVNIACRSMGKIKKGAVWNFGKK